MPEFRTKSEYYTMLAEDLIENEPALEYIKEARPTIIVLESDYAKKSNGKLVLGQCEKVASRNKWSIQADYTITIYTANLANKKFTETQERIVMFHELLHIGIGDGKFYVKPHDLEDFRTIINQYGAYWDEGMAQ